MICIILAAGYATRLYPLTENYPKPLLKIGNKCILDWIIDDIENTDEVDKYCIVANHRFAKCFEKWAIEKKYAASIIDDGTETNDTRLGAVRDLSVALEVLGATDDCLVLAGDNLLDFSLDIFISYAKKKGTSCVMRYFENDADRLSRAGVLTVGDNDLVVGMQEKPTSPKSNWCCPPFYYLKARDIARIDEAIENGCGTDAPGSFIAWLCERAPIHAMKMPGKRYDIGSITSYEYAQREYKGINQK